MITAEDLEAHNKDREGGWVVIHGKVYDIMSTAATSLPCGTDKLMEYVGRDATKGFEMVGHSESAKEMMEQYLVGQFSEVCVCMFRVRQELGQCMSYSFVIEMEGGRDSSFFPFKFHPLLVCQNVAHSLSLPCAVVGLPLGTLVVGPDHCRLRVDKITPKNAC